VDLCDVARKFNQTAARAANTVVLVSRPTPSAASRFCANQGLANVVTLIGRLRGEQFLATTG